MACPSDGFCAAELLQSPAVVDCSFFYSWYSYFLGWLMEDKPLAPRWFIQGMASIAILGFTIPMIAGVAGYLKQELRQPPRVESKG